MKWKLWLVIFFRPAGQILREYVWALSNLMSQFELWFCVYGGCVSQPFETSGINFVRKTTYDNSRAGNDTQNHRELHQGTPENDNEMWVCFKPFTLFTYQLRYILHSLPSNFPSDLCISRVVPFIHSNFSLRSVSFRPGLLVFLRYNT